MRHALILAAALLPPGAQAAGHELSLAGGLSSTSEIYLNLPTRPGLEATYTYGKDVWRVGGGVRIRPTRDVALPLEVYGRALLTAQLGTWWQPSVGPELGLSAVPVVTPSRSALPQDYPDSRVDRFGPLYVAFHAEPLRFVFRRFTVSALEVQWGTHLAPRPGSNLRMQVGLLRLGVVL